MSSKHSDELREMSVEDLRGKLDENKQELFNLRFQLATGSLDNSSRVRQVKKEIARIHTVIREKELGIARVPAASSSAAKKEARR